MMGSRNPSGEAPEPRPAAKSGGLSDAQFSVLFTVLRLVANGAIGIVTSRGLGAFGRGVFALIVTFHNVVATVGRFGLTASGVYFMGKGRFTHQETTSSGLTASLLTGIGSAALGVCAVFLLRGRLFPGVHLLWPMLSVALVPLVVATSMAAALLLGIAKVRTYNWSQSAGAGLQLTLTCALWAPGWLTTQTAIIAWAISLLVAALYTVVKLGRLHSLRPRWRSDQLHQMMGFGLQSYLSDAVLQLNMRFDFLLVSLFAGYKALGLYSVSALLSQLPWIFPNGLSYALYPRVTSSNLADSVRITEKGMRHAFLLSFLTSAFLVTTAKYLVPAVFGKEFSGSVVPLAALLPGAILFGLTWLQSMFLIGQAGKPLKVGYAYLFIFVLNVILNVLLTPRHGILGAAIASSASRLVGSVALFHIVASEGKSSWHKSILVRGPDLADLGREVRTLVRLGR